MQLLVALVTLRALRVRQLENLTFAASQRMVDVIDGEVLELPRLVPFRPR
jgi:hypothetical protein